jgi:hypothetical protein
MSTTPTEKTSIPAKVWAVGIGLGIFTALLLRVLTATWPHSIEAGAVVAGLQLITFATVQAAARNQRR